MKDEQKAAREKNSFTTAQQEIWKTRIRSERDSIKEWEANWGFLIGDKPKEGLPDSGSQIMREEFKSVFAQAGCIKEKLIVCSSPDSVDEF
jgi:hypothetical protein